MYYDDRNNEQIKGMDRHFMMEYARGHESFRKHMDEAYDMVVNWYWMKYSGFIEVDIELFRDATKRKNRIYTRIQDLCMTCVIDKTTPIEEQVTRILEDEHQPTRIPF